MSKRIPFLFFIILIVSTMPLPRAKALGIGPPSFELDLQMDGSNSTTVYLLSDGLEGELIIGSENLPFRVEPSKINMSKEDNYRPVELTFYGNETLESGVYEGMVTFIAQTGGFVSLGIKIRAKINLLGEDQEETEMPIEEKHAEEPEAETEPETMVEGEEHEEEPEIESEEDPENESQENSGNPYITGGLLLGTIVALGLTGIWLKRR